MLHNMNNFLFLVLLPQLISGHKVIHKLGCKYINEDFAIRQKLLKKPVYGSSMKALPLQDNAELDTLLGEIKKINGEIIDNTIYNSVDNILEIPKSRPKYMHIFFMERYKPKYHPHSPAMGLAVDVAEQIISSLSSSWPNISSSVYLGAAQNDVYVTRKDLISWHEGYLLSKQGRLMIRAITVVKICLGVRKGHILIDPAAVMLNPVVLMRDGGEPLRNNEYVNPNGKKLVYKILKNSRNFILVKEKGVHQRAQDYIHYHHLFFVGLPYCSGVDTSEKLNLLERDRYLFKTNRRKDFKTGISFSMLPTVMDQSFLEFSTKLFKVYIEDKTHGKKELLIKFSRLLPKEEPPVNKTKSSGKLAMKKSENNYSEDSSETSDDDIESYDNESEDDSDSDLSFTNKNTFNVKIAPITAGEADTIGNGSSVDENDDDETEVTHPLTEKELSLINEVNSLLGYKPNQLLEKLKMVAKMKRDVELVRDMYVYSRQKYDEADMHSIMPGTCCLPFKSMGRFLSCYRDF